MPDINYVIGAKDNASKTLGNVGKSLEKMDLSFKTMAKGAAVFTAASFAFGKIASAINGLRRTALDSITAFDRQTESIRALNQAMELNGGGAAGLTDKYSALADEIERTLNIEAETIMDSMKLAATLGVQNEQLDDVTIAAIGLSEAMGIDLADAMKKVRTAQEGHFESFMRILPKLKDMATDEERLAAVQELARKGLALKTEASKSATGETVRMWNSLDNLKKALGGLLSPFQQVIVKGITALADALTGMLIPVVEATKEAFARWGENIVRGTETTVNAIIAGITMIEVVFGNIDKVLDLVAATMALRYEQMKSITEHLFTVALPAYIGWFTENFTSLIRDGFDAVLTIIINLGQKIRDSFAAIWDFISSGGETDVMAELGKAMGGSLLEGFRATTNDLPKIAERVISADEQALRDRIGRIGGDLGNEFQEKFNRRKIKLGMPEFGGGFNLDKTIGAGGVEGAALQVTEGRLLTRGPGGKKKTIDDVVDKLTDISSSTEASSTSQAIMASEMAKLREKMEQNDNVMLEGVS